MFSQASNKLKRVGLFVRKILNANAQFLSGKRITNKNGAFEVVRGTHLLTKEKGLELIKTGAKKIEPILLNLGDVMICDVRGLHRGTPNRTRQPRPMCVVGYSRKWLFRPEVSIRIPRRVWENLSPVSQKMLRFNPIVESLETLQTEEVYQSFAF